MLHSPVVIIPVLRCMDSNGTYMICVIQNLNLDPDSDLKPGSGCC